MSLLRTSDLTRRYGGLTAVDNVDFELPEGEVHALIGPNGAGKSTFVGMVSGRIQASEGRVEFEGRDVTELPAHKRIRAGMAYTFQITSIYARLSLFDNIALAMGNRNRAAAVEALARVGLDDRADQIAGDLSYGHQRLLEIAMGVAQAPRLLILNEPTQGLAESEIEGFNAIINGLRGQVVGTVFESCVVIVVVPYRTILGMAIWHNPQIMRIDIPKPLKGFTGLRPASLWMLQA